MRMMPVAMVALAGLTGCGKSAIPSAEIGSPSVEVKTVAFNVENAPTVTFDVPDMMCPISCAPKVKETLASAPGVRDVKVDLETKTATVAIDEEQFDADTAIDALVDVQFTNTTLIESK